ncbi:MULTISPECIES: hypothetical protein [unclassified Streptomyces]|uniref:hypothetical protein n=1 Tax=unclassified Streptomyces TaxID=2593676 RepID=UPI001F4111A6|nr:MULTISPECIES: hypothetical protein [unclassified Streptomyces]
MAVLLVAASAVAAGARSYAAVGQWSANAPQHTLAAWAPGSWVPWACASQRAPPRSAGSSFGSAPVAWPP